MERRLASKIARYHNMPISEVYKDTDYWKNTAGCGWSEIEIIKEDISETIREYIEKLLSKFSSK